VAPHKTIKFIGDTIGPGDMSNGEAYHLVEDLSEYSQETIEVPDFGGEVSQLCNSREKSQILKENCSQTEFNSLLEQELVIGHYVESKLHSEEIEVVESDKDVLTSPPSKQPLFSRNDDDLQLSLWESEVCLVKKSPIQQTRPASTERTEIVIVDYGLEEII
jgi:hypothetical protein